jgi:hypothetical protein
MERRMAALAAVIGVASLPVLPLRAQTPEEDRKTLEKKIEALEKQQEEMRRQLEELKQQLATQAPPAPVPTPTPAPAASPAPRAPTSGPVTSPGLTPYPVATWGETGQVTSGTTFNPAISVVAEGFYYADDRKGQAPSLYAEADGFKAVGVGGIRDLSQGFNLGETEFTFSAAVDPYFDALAILTVNTDGAGMEEAWIRTRRLLPGLSIKAGKFYSDVGYANRQHPHQWDFADQNLPYAMLLGGQLNEVGVQVEYLPKLPVYLLVGAEALQGTNPAVANYLGPDANPALSSRAGPRLFTGFLKVSPDIGWSDALQLGASGGYDTMFQEQDVSLAGEGTAWFGGFDAVFKHDSPRPFGQGDLTLQGEFLYREIRLDAVSGTAAPQALKLQQNGWYVQAVYGLLPRLQAALRWDAAGDLNRLTDGPARTGFGTSRRFSAALTFNPTEFSRLRAQFNRASIPVNGIDQTASQFFLQFQVSLGVHGAHKF